MPEKKPFNKKDYVADGEFLIAKDESHVLYRGVKYIQRNGYYKRARDFSKDKPCNLHRAVWMDHFGPIPEKHHIHHMDRNRGNNHIENLQCLPAFTHLSRAAKGNKWLKSKENKEHLKVIREKAHDWHKTSEGRAFLSQNKKDSWQRRKKTPCKCSYCGKEFEASFPSRAKYCHHNCRENARKKSGIENENRKCVTCSKYFVINKYCRTKTCCRECAYSMKRENKKKKTNPALADIV